MPTDAATSGKKRKKKRKKRPRVGMDKSTEGKLAQNGSNDGGQGKKHPPAGRQEVANCVLPQVAQTPLPQKGQTRPSPTTPTRPTYPKRKSKKRRKVKTPNQSRIRSHPHERSGGVQVERTTSAGGALTQGKQPAQETDGKALLAELETMTAQLSELKGKELKRARRRIRRAAQRAGIDPTQTPTLQRTAEQVDKPVQQSSKQSKGGNGFVTNRAEDHGQIKDGFGHPFKTDYCDHFETPREAYVDIHTILLLSAPPRSADIHSLRIWDPFYCDGAAKRHLESLGFTNVYHHNEDFYSIANTKKQPKHDVFVTNPPYSGQHKERCLHFCVQSTQARSTPWLLLLPAYIATKSYWTEGVVSKLPPKSTFFVAPPRGEVYGFDHPEGTGHADSPFFGIWFCHLPGIPFADVQKAFAKVARPARLYASVEDLAADGIVSLQRRPNPRQRKKMRRTRG